MWSRILTATLFLLAGWLSAAAQQFEVASIKPTAAASGPRNPVAADPSRVAYNGFTAKMLIQLAYKLPDWQVSGGPGWLDSEFYDVAATLPAGAKESDVPAMIQALLAERFQLATRREMKEMPVYRLVAGKNGPKLKAGETGELWKNGATGSVLLRGRIVLPQGTMGWLASMLARPLRRPVLDATNVKGNYSIDLKFAPDDAAPGSKEAEGPSIFTALEEQLGLKVEPAKMPIDTLVVTQISKPSAN